MTHARFTLRASAKGFTLIELVVVMAVIALLLTLAVPRYFNAIDNSRVAVQRHNIAALRDSIDKFFGDNGRYPENLAELVSKRYLREIPADPLTENADWIIVPPQDTTQGGVYDIKSAYKADGVTAVAETSQRGRPQARDPAAPTANAPMEPETPAALPLIPASSTAPSTVKS
jgi:general secretion pathway protein G